MQDVSLRLAMVSTGHSTSLRRAVLLACAACAFTHHHCCVSRACFFAPYSSVVVTPDCQDAVRSVSMVANRSCAEAAAAHESESVLPQHPPQLLQLLPVVTGGVTCAGQE